MAASSEIDPGEGSSERPIEASSSSGVGGSGSSLSASGSGSSLSIDYGAVYLRELGESRRLREVAMGTLDEEVLRLISFSSEATFA